MKSYSHRRVTLCVGATSCSARDSHMSSTRLGDIIKVSFHKWVSKANGAQKPEYPYWHTHTGREREKGRTKLSVSALTSASGAGSSYGSGSRRQSLKSWPDVATRHLFNDGSHLPRPCCGNATSTPPPCQPVSPSPPQRSHMRRAVGHKSRAPS